MSVTVMGAVFRWSQSEGAARLVLLALADVAADTGEVTAYARSHSILAGKANVAEGTVRRALNRLVEIGEVVVLAAGGGRKSASYQINVGPPAGEGAPDEGGPDVPPPPTRRAPTPRGVHPQGAPDEPPVSPSPSVDGPSVDRLPLGGDVPTAPTTTFAEFWSVYPRRRDRATAEKAWAAAVKTTDPGVIVAGARRYAAERAGQDPKFTKHPATWLRAGSWADEPDPVAPAKPDTRAVNVPRTGPGGRIKL